MRKIQLASKNGKIKATVLPEYGGMLVELLINGKPVIQYDPVKVETTCVYSEAAPILFPFASRTKNDRYVVNGKNYYMPFHGLVHDMAFSLERMSSDEVAVKCGTNTLWKRSNYPFDFELEINYSLKNQGLVMDITVENHSTEKLFHSFGWHPFFVATDKSDFLLHVNMEKGIDFSTGKRIENTGFLDVSKSLDMVLEKRTAGPVQIINHTDGYKAEIYSPECFQCVVVCSVFDKKVCVEPWVGVPDSANTGKYLAYIDGRSKETYQLRVDLEEIR